VKHFNYKLKALQRISGLLVPHCIVCGTPDIRVLTINHKNGHSTEGKQYIYLSVASGKRKINDLDIRCYNCNILYEFEEGRRTLPSFRDGKFVRGDSV
jgi:hypothetical protein